VSSDKRKEFFQACESEKQAKSSYFFCVFFSGLYADYGFPARAILRLKYNEKNKRKGSTSAF